MSTFEFVSVLVSIIIALAITRILKSLASVLEYRSTVRVDLLVMVWAAHLLIYSLIWWWVVMGNYRDQESWRLVEFLALCAYGVSLYFASALILPGSSADGPDLRARYEAIRRPFFSVLIATIFLEFLDTFLKGGIDRIIELGPFYYCQFGLALILSISALWISDRRLHWFMAVTSLASNLVFFWTFPVL